MVTKTTRQLARRKVLNARQRGELVPPDACSKCGEQPEHAYLMEAHHEDYSKPLDVVWLCLSCHRKHHSSKGPDAQTARARAWKDYQNNAR